MEEGRPRLNEDDVEAGPEGGRGRGLLLVAVFGFGFAAGRGQGADLGQRVGLGGGVVGHFGALLRPLPDLLLDLLEALAGLLEDFERGDLVADLRHVAEEPVDDRLAEGMGGAGAGLLGQELDGLGFVAGEGDVPALQGALDEQRGLVARFLLLLLVRGTLADAGGAGFGSGSGRGTGGLGSASLVEKGHVILLRCGFNLRLRTTHSRERLPDSGSGLPTRRVAIC